MLSVRSCFLLGAALLAGAASAQTQPVRDLVEVTVQGPAQLRRLLALDLDLAACGTPLPGQNRVEVIARAGDLQLLQAAGLPARVMIRDLSAYYAAEAARWPTAGVDVLTPPLGQGAMGGHWTLAQMEAILDSFHAQYPQICSAKVSIGRSIQNRDIWMVKISDNVDVDEPSEPKVLYDALHHAREPLSMEATLLFMSELLAGYGTSTDPEATFLINERELFFVPCVNPDGYEYNHQTNPNGGGLWRKNRRQNSGGSFGVDLNRNYATGWNGPYGGSSGTPTSDVYRGTAPFSEPETQAMDAFAASKPFVTVFTTHTYQDVLLRPWGWQPADPPNVADYNQLGAFYTVENGLQNGSISGLLYIADGNAVDHHHAVHGMNAWTAELGRSNEGGFWPSGANITAIARRNQPMFRKIALTSGPAFTLVNVAVSEAPGSNGNLVIEPGETGQVVATVRNLGLLGAAGTLALVPASPGITVLNSPLSLGTVARLSTGNSATPLRFSVPLGYGQAVAHLLLQVTGDGRTTQQAIDVMLSSPRRILDDDFEQDHGFQRGPGGTALTGLWERAAPQLTMNGSVTVQPGSQTTPGGSLCWVTDGRAGTAYSVSGGYTELLSPVLDLRHLGALHVLFDLWFNQSSGSNALDVSVSRDGGANWSSIYTRTTSTGAFTRLDLDTPGPFTALMQVKVRAQNPGATSPAFVEALVDGFELRGVAADGAITALSSGAAGTSLRLGMNAPVGALLFPLGSPLLGPGTSFPGVAGQLLLDPATAVVFPLQVVGAAGYQGFDIAIPPGFASATFHFQTVWLTGIAAFGGNEQAVTLH